MAMDQEHVNEDTRQYMGGYLPWAADDEVHLHLNV
jgi:hypothetical protein